MASNFPKLVFVHGTTIYSKLIRFGERLRFGKDASYWNHVAILVNGQGDVVEALSQGVVRRNMHRDWGSNDFQIVSLPSLTPEDAAEMLAFLDDEITNGTKYGWLTVFSIAAHLLTGGKITVGLDGTEICSGLAARMLERGTAWFENPADVMPAQLAVLYGARSPHQ